MVSISGMCQDRANTEQALERKRIKVDLVGVSVDLEDWTKFQGLVMISKEKKEEFISDTIDDMVHHILYENPELFNSYVLQSRQPPSR